MTEVTTEPGPLWPDDVVAGAHRAVHREHGGSICGASCPWPRSIVAALSAPEVTAHLLAQHKDGYDSGAATVHGETVDILQPLVTYLIDNHADIYGGNHCIDVALDLLRERARLAAALADAEGKIAAAPTYCASTDERPGEWQVPPTPGVVVDAVRAALSGDAARATADPAVPRET